MGIDIFEVQPHKVSRDLRGYTFLFYGDPGTGKTTIASKFEKTLLLATEIGYLTIPNIMAIPINSWSEIKKIIKQLKEDKAKEMYYNICIDTVDLAYNLCEQYICNREGVEKISDIPWGSGYKMVSKEFDEVLRTIPRLGYGLIMISHAQDKTFTDENGSEFNQIVPTLDTRSRLIVDRMTDILGFAHPVQEEDGTIHSILYMRQTPRYVAKSRFKYTPDFIDFTYNNLVKAINDAIDQESNETNNEFVTEERTQAHEKPDLNYDALMAQFNDIIAKLQEVYGDQDFSTKWAPRITSIVETYLGKGRLVSDLTPVQVEQLDLIVNDLVEIVGLGI